MAFFPLFWRFFMSEFIIAQGINKKGPNNNYNFLLNNDQHGN